MLGVRVPGEPWVGCLACSSAQTSSAIILQDAVQCSAVQYTAFTLSTNSLPHRRAKKGQGCRRRRRRRRHPTGLPPSLLARWMTGLAAAAVWHETYRRLRRWQSVTYAAAAAAAVVILSRSDCVVVGPLGRA